MKKTTAIILSLIFIFTLSPWHTVFAESGSLSLTAAGADGMTVSVPSGDCGERVSVKIPLLASGIVTDIVIAPVISTVLDEFVFDVEKLDYTLSHQGNTASGEIIEFLYDFRIRDTAPSGLYETRFSLSYTNANGERISDMIPIYVKVNKGFAMPTPDTSGTATPVLMLKNYVLSAEKIYAGEEFSVSLTVKNTSREESVKNIQLRLNDASGNILPVSGSSSSVYIDSLGRGDEKTVTFSLQSSPDANEAKYALGVVMTYQGSESLLSFNSSESITVPILQKQRIKIDTPVLYDDATVGTVSGVSLAIYNMGKTNVYNCTVTVEGEGLSLVESFFGGTLAPGETLRPDLEVLTSSEGLINGSITVTYEDAYGTQSTQTVPLEIRVEKEPEIVIPTPDNGDAEKDGASFPWWIIIAAAAVVLCAVFGIKTLKKRKADLEDI